MKHNKKVNPLTHFNNLKAEAVKKGNGQLANYKKSLKRFQGDVTGSQVSSAARDAAMDNKINMSNNVYNTERANARKLMEEYYKKADNEAAKKALNNSSVPIPGLEIPSSTKTPIQGAYDEYKTFKMSQSKNGGSVKKMQMGGRVNTPKRPTRPDDRVNADGSKPKTVAPGPRPPVSKIPTKRPPVSKIPTVSSKSTKVGKSSDSGLVGYVLNNPSSKKVSSVSGKTIIKEKDGSVSINKKNTDSINKAHAAGKTVYIPRNKYGGSTKKRK